ncbi:hypothetical protein QN277_024059 [Acacia crassicarpa]|uniref:Uncharacterized protein n=1 Tax=Acacia crassicarpa TaxID=499986 RepID=A0AAE1JEF9_9FABA|nr:hypothetical protein QN277_024059 [Acacia crassicarpa]
MVLDSPFSDLVDLEMELVDTYKVRLPKFTVKFAIQYMRKAIQKKAKFDTTQYLFDAKVQVINGARRPRPQL